MENKIVLKVSSKSNPNSVAGAIAGGLQENSRVTSYRSRSCKPINESNSNC